MLAVLSAAPKTNPILPRRLSPGHNGIIALHPCGREIRWHARPAVGTRNVSRPPGGNRRPCPQTAETRSETETRRGIRTVSAECPRLRPTTDTPKASGTWTDLLPRPPGAAMTTRKQPAGFAGPPRADTVKPGIASSSMTCRPWIDYGIRGGTRRSLQVRHDRSF